jgi:hypothetical protein
VTGSSGPIVTAGLVISSAAVTALARACSRCDIMLWSIPGTVPSSASLVSRSDSETTPMTLLCSSSTGNALTRCARSMPAMSLYEAFCLTAIT